MKNIISNTLRIDNNPVKIKLENNTISIISPDANNTDFANNADFVITKENNEKFELSTTDAAEIALMSKLTDYLTDITVAIESRMANNIYKKSLLSDTVLINSMLAEYTELRNKNNGGDPDNMLDWTECIDELFHIFYDRLEQYAI